MWTRNYFPILAETSDSDFLTSVFPLKNSKQFKMKKKLLKQALRNGIKDFIQARKGAWLIDE
ncbi:MAG: hypothetical protein ACFFD4_21785, partial [Candidatus Odinarchaeota archaeon]